MKNRIFTVILYKEDDIYIAECPKVGTVDQGETMPKLPTSTLMESLSGNIK